jgi:two-component system, cell cycle response regulator
MGEAAHTGPRATTPDSRRSRAVIYVPFAAAVACWLGYIVFVLADSPSEWLWFADLALYNGAVAFAGVACLGRAWISPAQRAAWISFGLGLLLWSAADVYWVVALDDLKRVPYPSWADVGYLAALPCFYIGAMLLVRRRVGHMSRASWLDGAIGALAAAAVATAFLAPALVGLTRGDAAAVFTNLAYPIGDIVLLAFIVGAVAVIGVRGSGALLLVGAGLLAWAVSDTLYLYLEATSSYSGGPIDHGWLLGSTLMGAAALASASGRQRPRSLRRPSFVLPLAAGAMGVGVLVWDHFDKLNGPSILLAGATLGVVLTRLAVSFRENWRLVEALRDEASTDALTGLANRRQLLDDLQVLFESGFDQQHLFAMFDLDGFKAYNDNFGHPAGDALLKRLASGLQGSTSGAGRAYRLGGDEFCILVRRNGTPDEEILGAAHDALAMRGDGFAITASGGSVILPDEARNASDTLRLADDRMYAQKAGRPGRVERHTRDLLRRILSDRDPALAEHQRDVSRLAHAVARELSLSAEHCDIVMRASEFHDIGKIAIPDEILEKPGELDEVEWGLIRTHTLIGERILSVSPAMIPVAQAVRSSHERWDGDGYPDGLASEQIPIASRIVFVCDAYDTMRSERSYSGPLSHEEAVTELRRCAGAQFDRKVVDVFCRVVERGDEAVGEDPATTLTESE